ncbi:hypothetical protein B5G00_16580, partial [Blautia sp. An46]
TDRSHLRSKGHEISRRLMSDRLLSGRGQYLSKTAKVGYKQFYMCGFEGTDLLNKNRGLVQW